MIIKGLSVPVPRGRKGKKLKNQLNAPEVKSADWLVHCNPEVVLQDDSYKKHLKQHCNKSVPLTPITAQQSPHNNHLSVVRVAHRHSLN